ncbi:MAG: type IV pilus modification PilV family protein, partial [Haliea sp.]
MMQNVGLAHQRGGLLIEVLVTIAIVVIGLWGLMDVQSRLQRSEMESYQRTQALILLNDMASRMTVNRLSAANYVTETLTPKYVGVGMSCAAAPTGLVAIDRAQWCQQLQGAAETSG